MAQPTIDQQGNLGATMDNGEVVPVPLDWEGASIYRDPKGKPQIEVITYKDGREIWFTTYEEWKVEGRGGLADGRTRTNSDGSTCTRYGDEMVMRS